MAEGPDYDVTMPLGAGTGAGTGANRLARPRPPDDRWVVCVRVVERSQNVAGRAVTGAVSYDCIRVNAGHVCESCSDLLHRDTAAEGHKPGRMRPYDT